MIELQGIEQDITDIRIFVYILYVCVCVCIHAACIHTYIHIHIYMYMCVCMYTPRTHTHTQTTGLLVSEEPAASADVDTSPSTPTTHQLRPTNFGPAASAPSYDIDASSSGTPTKHGAKGGGHAPSDRVVSVWYTLYYPQL